MMEDIYIKTKNEILTHAEFARDITVVGWLNITEKDLLSEIEHSMTRNQIEDVIFQFKTLSKLN